MVKTYNGNSPRNARIKVDYTGESPSVKFEYPRKDGYVGSMFMEILGIWSILVYLVAIIFGVGVAFGADTPYNKTTTNQTNLENNTKDCTDLIGLIEFTKQKQTFKEKLFIQWDFFNGIFGFLFIFFVPPILINKLFKKQLNNLFPRYIGWRAKKKYVRFKKKDIKISNINGKKEIYVEIPYFDNVILNYKAIKDFSKYLNYIDITEHNFKTMEDKEFKKRKRDLKKGKKQRKVLKQNEWSWSAKFSFNKLPEKGFLDVVFR